MSDLWSGKKLKVIVENFFIYFVINTSQLLHLGELPWESKVKHISLHFAWKETPMIFGVASHSPSVTPGAHRAPSCSVNGLLCPGCFVKPQEGTTKARTFTRGQIPARGVSCQGKKGGGKKQHFPSQVSMVVRRKALNTCTGIDLKKGMMWSSQTVHLAKQLKCWPAPGSARHRPLSKVLKFKSFIACCGFYAPSPSYLYWHAISYI